MPPEPIKSNGTKRLYWILGLIVSAIIIFAFVQNQMSATVANHPKIVKMETTQDQICRELEKLNKRMDTLDDIDKKLAKLLLEEYP